MDLVNIKAEAEEALALAEQATYGPWAIEAVGEKGDGSNMIGVVYSPDDPDCKQPLSGLLPVWGTAGNEIDYYRDELVAECEHRNRNSGADAAFIARARTLLPALARAVLQMQAVVEAAQKWKRIHIATLQACETQDDEGDWFAVNEAAAAVFDALTAMEKDDGR